MRDKLNPQQLADLEWFIYQYLPYSILRNKAIDLLKILLYEECNHAEKYDQIYWLSWQIFPVDSPDNVFREPIIYPEGEDRMDIAGQIIPISLFYGYPDDPDLRGWQISLNWGLSWEFTFHPIDGRESYQNNIPLDMMSKLGESLARS